MSDVVERLQAANEWMRAPDWNDDLDLVSWLHRRPAGGFQGAIDEITRLTAEVERRDAALRECETELNAYYRMEYPGDHPYSQKELAQAMASNPATVALKETSND
jgi:hypothetical protein